MKTFIRWCFSGTWLLLPLLVSTASSERQSLRELSAVAVDHGHPGRTWAIFQGRLFRSNDGGLRWASLEPLMAAHTYAMNLWVLPSPGPAVFVATRERGLVRTLDDGATWQFANRGLPQGIGKEEVTPIISLVSSAADRRNIYVLTEAQGIFRSVNGGDDWQSASNGLPVPFHHRTSGSQLAVDPENSQRLYAVLNVPVTSHHNRAVLFYSRNAGGSWAPLKDFQSEDGFSSITVDANSVLALKTTDGKTILVDASTLFTEYDDEQTVSFSSLLGHGSAAGAFAATADRDIGDIAVMEDDAAIVTRTFDLSGQSIEFRPNRDETYDVVPVDRQFQADTGSPVMLADEDYRSVALPFPFPFYTKAWRTMFVNSNGSVSFERGERSSFPTVGAFFAGRPRISPLWADFDPSAGGTVLVKAAADKVVVTWNAVPIYRTPSSNSTMQIVLLPNGIIRFNFEAIKTKSGITGISNGFKTSGNFVIYNGGGSITGLAPSPIVQVFDRPAINPVQTAMRFYQTHDDDFDELIIFAASDYPSSLTGGGFAYFAGIKNDVRGIGISTVDYSSQFGSGGKLQGIINMNRLSEYPSVITDPLPDSPDEANAVTILGQEAAHRFGSYVRFRDDESISSALLGRSASHWSYFLNTDASVLEGNRWRDDGDENFTVLDQFRTYSKLDLYLMGLLGPSEVPPLMLITDPQPLMSGVVTSVGSTFGKTSNAIRDAGKDFGSPDRLKGLRISLSQSSSFSTLVAISNSGRTQDAPAPDTISTEANLATIFKAAPGHSYQILKGPASTPQSRYFDFDAGKFAGENLVFKGVRRDLSVSDIIEYEGERVPAKGSAPSSFRLGFILLVPRGKTATTSDLAKVSTVRRQFETFFRTATAGLGSVSTEVKSGLSQISRQVQATGLSSYATQGVSSAATAGYARLEAGDQAVSGVAFITGKAGDRTVTETAVPALGTFRRARFFVEKTQTVNTGVAVAVPFIAGSITLQLRNSDGALSATSTLNVGAGSQTARFANELFPSFNFPAEFRGTITVSSTVPVVVVSLRTFVNESGEFLMTSMPVADLDFQQPGTSYLAHYADGGGYGTDVVLMNPAAAALAGTVEFHASDGTTTSTMRYALPANGSQVLSTGTGTGTLRSGYILVRADEGQDGAITRAIITARQNGKIVAMTGMFPSVASSRARLIVDLRAAHDSGIAVLNDSGKTANLRLTVYNSAGTAVQTPATFTLGSRNQTAKFVSQWFSLRSGFSGIAEISSDTPVQIVALRSTAASDRFLLAAFPVETLDIPRPERLLYFPHLVDGAGFTSEIFIMNLGTDSSTPKLSFVSQQGDALRLPILQTR